MVHCDEMILVTFTKFWNRLKQTMHCTDRICSKGSLQTAHCGMMGRVGPVLGYDGMPPTCECFRLNALPGKIRSPGMLIEASSFFIFVYSAA